MSSFVIDIKHAFRSFRSTPGLVAAALITLALGVGANTAMFSIVNGILLAPLGYPDEDAVVAVWAEKRHSTLMIEEIKDATTSFAAISGLDSRQYTLVGGDEPEVIGGEVVGTEHFEVIGLAPVLGRSFFPEDAVRANGPVVILSHEFWTRRFGADPSLVGQMIDLSGGGAERHLVVGILPPNFPSWWAATQVWVPIVVDENTPGYSSSYGTRVIARLAPGVPVEVASQEMARLVPSFAEQHPTQFRNLRHSPIDVLPLHELAVREVRGRLLLMLGAVTMVLLIACTNVANLLLARGVGRRQEIGLRLALGASRARVARMVFTESALLALVGGTLGIGAASISLPVIVSQIQNNLPRTAYIQLDLRVLAFGLAASVLAGLLFGVGPAVRAAGQEPAQAMGDATRSGGTSRRRVRLTDLLVTTEIALSVVLVLGAGLMLKSLWRLSDVDPGFDGSRTLTMRFMMPAGRYDSTDARRAFFDDVTARIRALPGVEQVAWSNFLPLFRGRAGIPYLVEGQEPPAGAPSVVGSYKVVSPEFFEIMEMPLLMGRAFGPQDVEDADMGTVLINEAMAKRHWSDGSPIDATLLTASTREPFARVVGVVGDIRQTRLTEEPEPEFYFLGSQSGYDYNYLLLRGTADPITLATPAKTTLRATAPDIPILDVQTMADVVEQNLGSSKFYLVLFGAFAALALALGVIGVYGVMAYAISQRTKEIGVRAALGATRRTILVSTILKGMTSVGTGIVVGLVSALVVSRLFASLLYEVQPNDVTVYLAVAAILGVAGVVANVIPAWRASQLDPIIALRAE